MDSVAVPNTTKLELKVADPVPAIDPPLSEYCPPLTLSEPALATVTALPAVWLHATLTLSVCPLATFTAPATKHVDPPVTDTVPDPVFTFSVPDCDNPPPSATADAVDTVPPTLTVTSCAKLVSPPAPTLTLAPLDTVTAGPTVAAPLAPSVSVPPVTASVPAPDTAAVPLVPQLTDVLNVTPDATLSVPPLSAQLPPVTAEGPAFTFTTLPLPLTLSPAVHVTAAAAVSVPPESTVTADANALCAAASVSTPAVTDVNPLKPITTFTVTFAPLTRSVPDVSPPATEAPAVRQNALAWKSSVAPLESDTAPDHVLAPLGPPPRASVPVPLTLTALPVATVSRTFTELVLLPVFTRPPLPPIVSAPEPESMPFADT